MTDKIKKKCISGCGYTLSAPELFSPESYCAKYCCGCCPDARASPCQKEKLQGTMFDELRENKKII